MPSLSQIVDVVISRESKAVSQAGFGVPLILGLHTRFAERIRFYENIDGLAADGFLTSDDEYKAALAIFSQDLTPEQVGIGRRTALVAQVNRIDVTTVANSTLYTATINGVAHNYTSDADATALEIRDGLIAAINGGSEPVTAAIFDADSLTVTADVAGDSFSHTVTANLTKVAVTANNNIQDDIQAVIDADDGWYCLLTTSRTKQDILHAAASIEARKKIYVACSSDTAVRDNTAGNVLESLEALSYDRTGLLWNASAATFPEAAWAGQVLPLPPGSETWKFKTLSGQLADNLTTTQENNIENKNGNTYQEFGGNDIVEQGDMVSGEFIDVIRFIDWLESRMQERIFAILINAAKIPYTDKGVAIIEAAVRAQLQEGVNVGGLAENPEFTVTVPKVANVSTANKTARLLPDVEFEATLAGAIHKVQIRGRVAV